MMMIMMIVLSGQEEATTVEKRLRIIFGLYGKVAPTIVKQFLR